MTFVLVDCNNFYANCERVFNPALAGRPIVVLSNNDGCVVARSHESKALGIQMGVPFYQVKGLCDRHRVAVFSSNYTLYGDMSRRVMDTLARFAPEIEIYSIDEAFLRIDVPDQKSLIQRCLEMRQTVLQWTGLPVSVGIGPTKTLAKIANGIAKKQALGVCALLSIQQQDKALFSLPVEAVWGTGRRWQQRLNNLEIFSAAELRAANPHSIRQCLNVMGERIVHELRGGVCLGIEQPEAKQTIACSRSFGQAVTSKADLQEAVSCHAATAARKLRSQGSCTAAISVQLATNRFSRSQPQYSASTVYRFDRPTSDSCQLMRAARQCIAALYRSGYQYQRCGVLLLDLTDNSLEQGHLFASPTSGKSEALMALVDGMNKRWGRHTVFFAAQGIQQTWQTQAKWRSPRYTTSWKELPVARC